MASIQVFPAITEEEFFQACKALEQRSADRIDDTEWLSVRWSGEELMIRQKRKAGSTGDNDYGEEMEDEKLVEDDVEDVTIAATEMAPDEHKLEYLLVDFSIVLSPTYSVPVLWFSCRLGPDKKPLSLEQVYEFLVLASSLDSLRGVGVMGGISMAHHPVSDLPSFFLHPCNTQEALLALNPDTVLTPEEYLMLWLGLMGSTVGLHVPSKLFST